MRLSSDSRSLLPSAGDCWVCVAVGKVSGFSDDIALRFHGRVDVLERSFLSSENKPLCKVRFQNGKEQANEGEVVAVLSFLSLGE